MLSVDTSSFLDQQDFSKARCQMTCRLTATRPGHTTRLSRPGYTTRLRTIPMNTMKKLALLSLSIVLVSAVGDGVQDKAAEKAIGSVQKLTDLVEKRQSAVKSALQRLNNENP